MRENFAGMIRLGANGVFSIAAFVAINARAQAYTISNAKFTPTTAAAGQTVTFQATVVSEVTETGKNLHFEVFDGSAKVAHADILNQELKARTPRTFKWSYIVPVNLSLKTYTSKFTIYNHDWTALEEVKDIGSLKIVTSTAARTVSPLFFGMHLGAIEAEPWPTIAFKSFRTWDSYPFVSWQDIQPARGVYDWSKLDTVIRIASEKGVNITYTFGYTPKWASSNPGGTCDGAPAGSCYPPKDADWKEFVSQLTQRYRGRIHNYELWNEPNAGNFYKGIYAQLAKMEKLAAPIVRAAGAKMLAPSPQGSSSGAWLESYFKAGGGANSDAITFHSYLADKPETLLPLLTRIRAALTTHGLSSKPLWDTEHSWGEKTWVMGDTPENRSAFLARLLVLSFSAGIERSFWYTWDPLQEGTFGQLFDRFKRVILPPGVAHREVQRWLVNASMQPCTASSGIYKCHLTRGGGYQGLIVWNTVGNSNFAVPAGYTVSRTLTGAKTNITGSTVSIGSRPILLEKPGT